MLSTEMIMISLQEVKELTLWHVEVHGFHDEIKPLLVVLIAELELDIGKRGLSDCVRIV